MYSVVGWLVRNDLFIFAVVLFFAPWRCAYLLILAPFTEHITGFFDEYVCLEFWGRRLRDVLLWEYFLLKCVLPS